MVLTASRTGAMKFRTLRGLILPSVLGLSCSLQLFGGHPDSAFAQDASTNETRIAQGAQVTKTKSPKQPATQKQKNFGEWKPQDIDQQVPAIVAGRACSLPEV